MAVRFLLGRAGTGKTRHCLTAVAAALRDSALGARLFLIVPPQITFTTERALLTQENLGALRGTFRANALSFRRLAELIAAELQIDHAHELDDLARVITLEQVIREVRSELRLFGPVADRPGFVKRLDGMLRELVQFGHTAGTLTAVAARLREPLETDTIQDRVLVEKLDDLALLLGAWEKQVSAQHLDGETLLARITPRLGESTLARRARVWVDSFSAFTGQEVDFLVGLAGCAQSLDIALTVDPTSAAITDGAAPNRFGLFYRTEKTYLRLNDAFRNARVGVAPPTVFLKGDRFLKCAPLARVERELFSGSASAVAAGPDAVPECVEVWEAANPESEVRAAARRIQTLLAESPGLRCRDIGLIIPELDRYADAVRRVFNEFAIPHFIDQRRTINHHPLVEAIGALIALVRNGFAVEDLNALLKTGLTTIPDADVHALENTLLAHGITRTNLEVPWAAELLAADEEDAGQLDVMRQAIARANQIRLQLLALLGPWFAAGQKSATGSAMVRELFDTLARLGVPERMAQLIEQSSGNPEAVMLHQQAWDNVVGLLERLDQLFAQQPMTIEELAHVFEMAAENLTLGLIPPTLDQVLVSNVTRSRHPEMKVALILGALERRFPMLKAEDPLLNDPQRAIFNGSSEKEIPAGSDQALLDAQFYDYLAFTRACERLIVSYPVADPRGKAVVRSQYIGRLLALFPVLAVQHFDALRAGDLRQVGTLDELLRGIGDALARHRAAPQIPLANGVAAAARWLVNAPLPARERAEILWTALRPRGLPTLDPALAARFYPGPLRLSVSQLEQFAGCPLQYFFHYTLGLRRRQTLQLDQLELGNLFHRVLELVYDEIIAKALPWPNSTPTQLRAALDDAVAAAVAELHAELADATPAYGKLRRRATASLAVVLEGQRRAAAAGDLLPIATELVFGGKADARKRALPTLSLPTPQRRTVDLTGKIDRIDATEDRGAAAVIDYKTRGKELSLRTIYFGISLQLPVYLLVLRANANWLEGPLRPVASLFVPLTVSRATKTTPADVEEPEEDRFYKRVRPRGLIDAAARDVLDHTAETASNWYAMKFKGSGELSLAGGNDAVTHDEFALILDYVQYKIGELADGLATGLIAPQPWRQSSATACDLCDFQATCPFDRVNGDFRAVPKLNRKAALERMADDVRGATHG